MENYTIAIENLKLLIGNLPPMLPHDCNVFEFSEWYVEDIFQMIINDWQYGHPESYPKLLLDIGWYGNRDGHYKCRLIKDNNWECPRNLFTTDSRIGVIEWFLKYV